MPTHTYIQTPAKTTTPTSFFQPRGWSEPAAQQFAAPVLDPATQQPNAKPLGHSFSKVSVLPRAAAGSGAAARGLRPPQASRPSPKLTLNRTGLPDGLKAGVEALSGMSMDDVRVHYNSAKPAQLQALAYTQGTDIHVAPGQEKHLSHEAWHVVQQAQGRVKPRFQLKSEQVNDDKGLEHEADMMVRKVAAQHLPELLALTKEKPNHVQPYLPLTQVKAAKPTIQRAIGLEIEVPVPVDDLSPVEVSQIEDEVEGDRDATTPQEKYDHKTAAHNLTHKVPYGTMRDSQDGFHVDVDHESRVRSLDPLGTGWPIREGGQDSIMEIVTEKTETLAEFNTTMDKVRDFVKAINTNTANLTTRWVDPFGKGVNIGPLDYTNIGIENKRRPNHNWQGSVQVNIGIDPREYGSLAKWYAKSDYAKASKAPLAEQKIYQKSKDNVLAAVSAGKAVTNTLVSTLTKTQKADMGNMRGLRGWLTHLALYLLGGKGGVPGTTVKNITPILLKSPQNIAIEYGMTPEEKQYYLDNREYIMSRLVRRTGRTDLDSSDPLNADVVMGKDTNDAYRIGKEKFDTGTDFDDLSKGEQTALVAYETNLGALSDNTDKVAYAGKRIDDAQPVGPVRGGSTAVKNIPSVKDDNRGGVVVEFRNLPGFYDSPDEWRSLGQNFLKEADKRNKRGGTKAK